MAEILIRGMEMPKTPVLFCIHPDGKVFADLEGEWKEYKAFELPPHGRLIDADALLADVRKHSESYFADDFAHEWVDVSPTIIPASEEVQDIG